MRIEGVVHVINWTSENVHADGMHDGTTPCHRWFNVREDHNTEAADGVLVDIDEVTCLECIASGHP